MTVLVLDSSAVLAWLFADECTPEDEDVLRDAARFGAWVPGIWHLEIANALLMAERRRRIDRVQLGGMIVRLNDIRIQVDAGTNEHAFARILELARSNGLSIYDAAFLELALRRQLPLATRDRLLRSAARRHDVTVRPESD